MAHSWYPMKLCWWLKKRLLPICLQLSVSTKFFFNLKMFNFLKLSFPRNQTPHISIYILRGLGRKTNHSPSKFPGKPAEGASLSTSKTPGLVLSPFEGKSPFSLQSGHRAETTVHLTEIFPEWINFLPQPFFGKGFRREVQTFFRCGVADGNLMAP